MDATQSKKNFKIVFFLLDGLADNRQDDLEGKTPLMAANTPVLDSICKTGICGLHDPVQAGLACGSDTSHMSLFGYEPLKIYNGRGAFEAMGSGLEMEADYDIAFKSNFAYLNRETNVVERRRCDREFPHWGIDLVKVIDGLEIPGYEDFKVACRHATEHRCGIRVSGPGMSYHITGQDPLKDNLPLPEVKSTIEGDQKAEFTAKLVQKLSETIIDTLDNHPINLKRKEQGLPYTNYITLRGCGQRLKVEAFESKHGLRPFMIAPTAIIRGVGVTLGIPLIETEGATGYYDSNLDGKAEKAAELLRYGPYDFGFVHVKGTDDAGHDKSAKIKIEQIEKCDKMIQKFIEGVKDDEEKDYLICVTGDHTTPTVYGDHTYEPVPITMGLLRNILAKDDSILSMLKDHVEKFDEISCGEGHNALLGRYPSIYTIPTMLKLRDRYFELKKEYFDRD